VLREFKNKDEIFDSPICYIQAIGNSTCRHLTFDAAF